MASFRKIHHNNMYFGDKTKLVEAKPPVRAAVKDALQIPVRLYVAQHNFMDTLLSGNTILPGQAMDMTTTPLPYVNLTVDEGSTFMQVLQLAQAASFFSAVSYYQDPTTQLWFVTSFTYNGQAYSSITTGYYSMTEISHTDPLLNYYWAGWGITYFPGTVRPGSFEAYPSYAIDQYPIKPEYDSNDNLLRLDFVLDFTKTEMTYSV
ncbi:MAG: hypothetical protein PVG39_23695 [Desulfobacteraceae bacterium]|jgi:hypothetical protein